MNGPCIRLERRACDCFYKASCRHLHLLVLAAGEHKTEFVAGISRDDIAAAHLGPEPCHDSSDHLIGGVITIGAIDREEVLDCSEQHDKSFVEVLRAFQQLLYMLRQAGAVESPRRGIDARALLQVFDRLLTRGHDADEAMSKGGLAARIGEPSAG